MNIRQYSSLFAFASALLMCACNSEKPYTITGTLDLPAQLPYGDTIIDVPSFEDTWVYLLDFDNQVVDSTLIQDNTFKFFGEVKLDDAYFVQLACQVGQTLIAIEPGDIEVYINPDIIVTGTPSNDCMADLDESLANLNSDTYNHLAELTDSLRNIGEELSDSATMAIADEFHAAMTGLLEAAYEANKDNLGGTYAVLMRHSDVQSADEFEQAVAGYPDKVRNSQLIQLNLRALRQYEQMMQGSSLDELDPSMFAPAEEGVPQN